ncbi:pectate lyase [candidate division CSSED10-310 bacterium]|uniref:Pectate lyase n=1 Tax=candidate division CSSED10-310 bacterium TaxID=2855610 RepID=A0ABV6YXI6_UNCC1
MYQWNPDRILAASVSWLKHSGIINREVGSRTFGAFHYGCSLLRKNYFQTYSEITGYGISLLLRLYRQKADTVFLNLAINAAKHLVEVQLKDSDSGGAGAFAHGYLYQDKHYSSDYFSFDTGICLSGLADLYFDTEWAPLVEPIDRAATWLATAAQYEDGSFRARYEKRDGDFKPLPEFADWFNDSCGLHAKCSLGLIKAWEITAKPEFKAAALKSMDWVLSLQTEEGAFTLHKGSDDVYTHAHCYVLEALLFTISTLGSEAEKYKTAAQKAVDWLIGTMNPDGSFYRYYPARRFFHEVVTDATSQTARLLLSLSDDALNKYSEKALTYLAEQQWRHLASVHARGCFTSKRYKINKLSVPALKIMSWPTIFTIHAFLMFKMRLKNVKFGGRELF